MLARLYSGSLVAIVALCVGCGGGEDSSRPKRVPVSGTVHYKQVPLEGATVLFTPQDHQFAASARTDASGRFQLQTFEPMDGAVPGAFQVTIRKTEITGGRPPTAGGSDDDSDGGEAPPAVERSLIPEKYGRAQTSGLQETVKPEGENDFTFDLQD